MDLDQFKDVISDKRGYARQSRRFLRHEEARGGSRRAQGHDLVGKRIVDTRGSRPFQPSRSLALACGATVRACKCRYALLTRSPLTFVELRASVNGCHLISCLLASWCGARFSHPSPPHRTPPPYQGLIAPRVQGANLRARAASPRAARE
jgi:hypothetical protein